MTSPLLAKRLSWASGRLGVWSSWRLGVCVLFLSCHHFDPHEYTSPESLFRAASREFREGRFEDAQSGFQKLTFDLPARDTLLPRSRFMLAECYFGLGDYLTAAREFRRVADEFPADRMAPSALLRAGDSHAQLWRRPELDPSSGQTALATYQELQGRYPDAEATRIATARVRVLNDDFAVKEYQNAEFYFRRGAYDSAILYFKSLIGTYPSSSVTIPAWVRLVRSYRAIGYREEEQDTCNHLLQYYATSAEVRETCGNGSVRR